MCIILILLIIIILYYIFYNPASTTVIPLNIYQTWHTKQIPYYMQKNIEKLKSDNPEFKYYLYDEKMTVDFLQKNFSKDVVNAYYSLIPKAYKADLFRYGILYKYGGVYLDVKWYCANSFKLINLTDQEYFVKDRPFLFKKSTTGIYNALLVCKPKNKLLLKCINKIVENVNTKHYGKNSLYPTGPGLMADIFHENSYNTNNITLYFDGKNIKDKKTNTCILKIYPEYRSEQKLYKDIKYYNDLWLEKNIYS